MRKISLLLTFALVIAVTVPAFAVVDNVEITGEVETIFEIGHYGEDEDTTAELWQEGDVLDIDLPETGDRKDGDDFPAEKAFYQTIGLNITGNVDNIKFDLAVDTITNSFAEATRVPYSNTGYDLGENDDTNQFKMDTALLTVTNDVSTLKAGDLNGTKVDKYFINDEDMEGVDITTTVADVDVRSFVLGKDEKEDDFYGVTVAKDFGATKLTGKLYHAREAAEKVTDLALEANATVSNALTVNGQLAFNSAKEADTTSSFFNVNANYVLTDMVTVRGEFETVGEDFVSYYNDLEKDDDYNKFNVGSDFALNDNNTLKADYTVYDHANDPEKKNAIKLALDNTTGAFTNTASVEFIKNNGYEENTDITVLTLKTEYAMSDITTVTAKLVNQSADDVSANNDYVKYTYLAAGLDHKLSDNISWNTEAKYITGSNCDDTDDGEGNSLKTKLKVSF